MENSNLKTQLEKFSKIKISSSYIFYPKKMKFKDSCNKWKSCLHVSSSGEKTVTYRSENIRCKNKKIKIQEVVIRFEQDYDKDPLYIERETSNMSSYEENLWKGKNILNCKCVFKFKYCAFGETNLLAFFE